MWIFKLSKEIIKINLQVNKILLTGATGFIGSQLLKNLSYKNKIYITLRKKKGKILKSNNIIKIYFNNFKSLNKN